MRGRKTLSLLIAVNITGIICLVYFSIPYLTHNTTVANPNAMLPAEAWDSAGMTLTFGFVPLLVVNILISLFIQTKQRFVRLLFLIPSVVCFIIMISYWVISLA